MEPSNDPKNRLNQYFKDKYFKGKQQDSSSDSIEQEQIRELIERLDAVLDKKAPMLLEDIIYLRDYLFRELE